MPTTNDVRRYWNAHPVGVDSVPFQRGSREMFEAIYRRWLKIGTPRRAEFLASCQDKKVLEVGCGVGTDGRFLSEGGVDYQAVDLSFQSLKLAQEHFRLCDLPGRFVNADATRLPFAYHTFDVVYSFGVLHHVPDTPAACREVVRILKPGGMVRVMLYGRHSYHYYFVLGVVYPLIWLMLRLPGADAIARLGPRKLRDVFAVCRQHGLSPKRLLDVSTDTSTAGQDNYNPHSSFYSKSDAMALFAGFEDFEFWKSEIKYFPLPWFRSWAEKRFGFFLHMTARKPKGR
ncbi:MAG: class I SAM-dependent methyltransferase [Acidimicrobiia bacterium]|nr:class I SAM-dependent methyltransferase [Acidimicrobiia bacterium]